MRIAALPPLLAALLAASAVHAQAPTPEDHPGYALAQAIAASGCVLHQDDVGSVLDALGLGPAAFPQMALPLIQDGILMSTGNGTLTLVNWGPCTGEIAPATDEASVEETAEPDAASD
jgi:hypothetical protein